MKSGKAALSWEPAGVQTANVGCGAGNRRGVSGTEFKVHLFSGVTALTDGADKMSPGREKASNRSLSHHCGQPGLSPTGEF